jgi:hypothetical protein
LDVALAAGAAPPPPHPPRVSDLLLDGLAAHYNDGYSAGVPMLRQALTAFGGGMPAGEELRWLWLGSVAAAIRVWDHDRWDALSARHVQLARETGTLSELPLALTSRACALLFAGELTAAASLTGEGRRSRKRPAAAWRPMPPWAMRPCGETRAARRA